MQAIDPAALVPRSLRQNPVTEDTAFLFWGKAAARTWQVVSQQLPGSAPALVIQPRAAGAGAADGSRARQVRFVEAEHPIPGNGSFLAGQALLEFFDSLRRTGYRNLRVFLSGGASSLAWVKPSALTEGQLLAELESLYRKPLPIAELNRRRSRLCALKAGGAARWLRRIAPAVRARVELISDVAPFGPEVVGSGPFWDGRVPHAILADNGVFVQAFAQAVGPSARILGAGRVGHWEQWVTLLDRHVRQLAPGQEQVLVLGGEPLVQVPARVSAAARGGRMCQLAGQLALDCADLLHQQRLEILAVSSDGVDGRSGASGVWIGPEQAARLSSDSHFPRQLRRCVAGFDAASGLEAIGALLPGRPSGTNVQDLVALRIRA